MKMNKLVAGALALALSVSLAACSASSSADGSASATSSSSESTDTTTTTATGYTLGLGIVVDTSASSGTGQADNTAVALLIDADGVIVDAKLDVAQNVFATGSGVLSEYAEYYTKQESGADYGMSMISEVGEWYEHADAFCAYLVGMNVADIASIPTDGSDADLAAGCTISVDTFIAAAVKAAANATTTGAGEGDTLVLAINTEEAYGTTSATDDADGKMILESTFVAMTKTADGVVTSAVLDKTQPTFTFDTSDNVVAPADTVLSKLEQGDDYGMIVASGIGKEWYEQSAAFCAYLVGKTADEIAAIPADGSDADLAAGCTVGLDSMLSTAVKAAQ